MLNLKTFAVAITLSIASIGAFAQAASALAAPRVDQREAKQQARIAQGAASGQLSAKETNRLEKQQTAINKNEAMANAGGKVTMHERQQIHHMQAKTRQNIKTQKRDGQVAPKP
ncbi:MAG: hypothetical protein H7306_19190 [Bacteriovorax sp.]|nr:hypothetical protein [Rhizobacter sp.]